MKKFTFRFIIFSFLGMILTMQSCTSEDSLDEVPSTSVNSEESLSNSVSGWSNDFEEIGTLDYSTLLDIRENLIKSGVSVSNLKLNEPSKTRRSQPYVQVIKVKAKTYHPNRLGGTIDVSGVLLLPTKFICNNIFKHRIIIAPPPTYTYNKMAPSNVFQGFKWMDNDFHFNYLAFWTLQACSGFIVFFPDYPGFGDSYKQCQHPYLDSKAMVNSTLDLLKSAQRTLTKKGYKYKKDLIITGYSLGGFVASSLAREIETNPSHGQSVGLLLTGGTPCNLKQIADIVRGTEKTQHHFFLSYGLWGYKENAYPYININDFLKEPYASKSLSWFDGTHYELLLNLYFSNRPKDIYTEKFIKYLDTDPSISYMNDILKENSVKPWKNKCRFIMTHGTSDVSVYYQNAYDFSENQKKAGGNVTFIPTVGDHIIGIVPYYAKATLYAALYKY